jgi:hypothetical protein
MDLCARNDIRPDIKIIGPEEIASAYEELDAGNASGVRHVIDCGRINADAFERCAAISPPRISPDKPMSTCSIIGAICAMFCCCLTD